MVKKSHSPELIINKMREADILLNQGANGMSPACLNNFNKVLNKE